MKRKPIVYIAGPMRGYPQANAPAFDEARDTLIERDAVPVSPIDLDRADGMVPGEPLTDEQLRQCLIRDCCVLLNADAVILLAGWSDSAGAKAEYMLAAAASIPAIRPREDFRLSVVLAVELARREMNRRGVPIA
jgi:hypothetical protein